MEITVTSAPFDVVKKNFFRRMWGWRRKPKAPPSMGAKWSTWFGERSRGD